MKIKTLDKIINGCVIITLLGALATLVLSSKESTKKYVPVSLGTVAVSGLALVGATMYGIKRAVVDGDYEDK